MQGHGHIRATNRPPSLFCHTGSMGLPELVVLLVILSILALPVVLVVRAVRKR